MVASRPERPSGTARPSRAVRPSRRERNAQDKRARIFRAASELFAERGYGAVTTQEISDRADVGAGTLFRYAASKSELLVMVYNSRFRAAVDTGQARAGSAADPVAAILRLLEPTVQRARERAEDTAAYQRELLFGDAAERYRAEGLEIVARLEESIGHVLTDAVAGCGRTPGPDAVRVAASSVFAAMHLAIARFSTGAHRDADVFGDLSLQVEQIVGGVIATSPETARRASDTTPRDGRGEGDEEQ